MIAPDDARGRLATVAALLHAGDVPAVASAAQGGIAVLALLRPDAAPAWMLVALLALPALWYAWRVRLDARLFDALGAPSRESADTLDARLAALDATLAGLGLRRASGDATPTLDARIAGARRLLVRQAAVCAAQLALTVLLALHAIG